MATETHWNVNKRGKGETYKASFQLHTNLTFDTEHEARSFAKRLDGHLRRLLESEEAVYKHVMRK